MGFYGENDSADEQKHAVAGVAQDHGKEQGEKCQKPEGNIVFPVARHHAQNVKDGHHQPGDLVVAHLGGHQLVVIRRIVHGPRPAVFRSGGLEGIHIVGGDVAGEPGEAALGSGSVAHRGVFHGVLRLQDLRPEAGKLRCRPAQQRFAVGGLLIQRGNLLSKFVQALGGNLKFVAGDSLGQGRPQRHHFHLFHLLEAEEGDGFFRPQPRQGLLIHAVDVEVYAVVPQEVKVRGGEAAPLFQRLGAGGQGGALGAEGLAVFQGCLGALIKGFKVLVGEKRLGRRLRGVLLERQLHSREVGNSLEAVRVGALLFADVQKPQLFETVQQRVLLGSLGNNGHDLHFFDHVATPPSLFFAILPRTTAAVC